MHPDARKKYVNATVRLDSITFPSTWWIGLHTTALSTANLPTSATEVSRTGTGYTRMPMTTGMFTSATTANSTVVLTTGVQFPDPLTNWSTVHAVAIYDSSVTSGGSASTCWFFGNVATTVNVTAGNPIRISSGTTLGLSIGLA